MDVVWLDRRRVYSTVTVLSFGQLSLSIFLIIVRYNNIFLVPSFDQSKESLSSHLALPIHQSSSSHFKLCKKKEKEK